MLKPTFLRVLIALLPVAVLMVACQEPAPPAPPTAPPTSPTPPPSPTPTAKKASQHIKRDRAELEAEVLKLEKQKQEIKSLDEVGEQVKEFCARATERLDGFSFEERRLALEALQIKVVVGTGGVKLFGVIPSSYATIGQTSA